MGRSLGITAFVFLILSFPIPILGNWLSVLALLLASVAALGGDSLWSVVVALIGGVKMFFLSPTWMLLMYSARIVEGAEPYGDAVAAQQRSTNTSVWYFTLVIVLAPLVIVGWRAFKASQEAGSGGSASNEQER